MGGGASKSKKVEEPTTLATEASTPADVSNEPMSGAAASGAAALGAVLSGAGIVKVILIRHANAQPRDPEAAAVEAGTVLKPDTPHANAWTVGDLTRGLTAKGEEQAHAAAAWLSTHSLKAVISSEAYRATTTKEIMTEGRFPSGAPGCLTLHTLHPSRSGTPECEKMFDTLGYGTLRTYFADTSVEGCEGRGKEIFRVYMAKVTGELEELIAAGMADIAAGSEGDTVAVFGHAVFLNAVAVAVGEAMGIADAEAQASELELGEAQGIVCDAKAQTVTLCQA